VKILHIILTATTAAAVTSSYAIYCAILIRTGNFHVVERDQIYRSAQLSNAELVSKIELYQIRSVLNLRGARIEQTWYKDEFAVAQEYGIAHYDVMISARRPVPANKVTEILSILRNAPKPILVHCESGADRTGFVSALYRYAIQGQSSTVAAQELSLRYGHFPYLWSKTGAMDENAHAFFSSHSEEEVVL
jgi:protein tyrosine/serine phosphatase